MIFKKKMRNGTILKLLLILNIFIVQNFIFSCGRENNEKNIYIEDVSESFREINNTKPLWEKNPEIGIKHIRTIGELDAKDDNLLFYQISDVSKDTYGNLYILDRGNYRIQKFSNTGEFIETIGRRGQGPGEFINPIALDINKNGILMCADGTTKSIQFFNSEKKLIDYIRCEDSGDIISGARFISDSKIVVPSTNVDFVDVQKRGEMKPLVQIYDTDGNVINEFVKPKTYNNFRETHFGNSIRFTVDNLDNIYVTFRTQNRIEKYSKTGKLLMRITRPLNFDIVEPVRMENSMNMKQIPSYVSTAIDVDDKGRFWVCTYIKQPDEKGGEGDMEAWSRQTYEIINRTDLQSLDIFDQDGTLLCTIPLSINVQKMRIFGNKIYFISHEGIDIKEYEIIEKQ